MAARYYANAPATTLAAACTSGATSIQVTSITGFPISYPYVLILDRGQATEEIVDVTNGAGTTLTVTRGADSTTAFAHESGAVVEHGISARDPREANEHINATDNVHGVTGDVVGTSDTQTLTNKDLTSSTNVFQMDDFMPIGAILLWGGADPLNSNWLFLQGQAISRTTYATLFARYGTTHGVGDGSTTFNLPDMRDRAPVGASAGKALGSTGGSDSVTLATTNLPAHDHAIDHDHEAFNTASSGAHVHSHPNQESNNSGVNNQIYANGSGTGAGNVPSSGAHVHSINVPAFVGTSGSTGDGTAFSVENPRVALNYMVKAL